MPDRSQTTAILHRVRAGEADAAEELLPLVYDELRSVAAHHLRRERANHTLQATALIHEVYLKLIDGAALDLASRSHFVGIASRSMRQILVDHARRRGALKHGGDRVRVTLVDAVLTGSQNGLDVLDLDEALVRLAALDPRKAQVVELRFFGGLTMQEAAQVLGISPKTVEADWYMARAWLRRELARGAD